MITSSGAAHHQKNDRIQHKNFDTDLDVNTEELELLLKEGECLTVEFKERFNNKIDKDIVAFANTSGGRILIGVNDDGKIIGEKLTNELKANINCLARNCDPEISIDSIKQIDKVIVVEVGESNQKPHSCATGTVKNSV